jgi:hypothetical protein
MRARAADRYATFKVPEADGGPVYGKQRKGGNVLISHDFKMELAPAGAVKFAEEDALPAAEGQVAVGNEDGLGVAYQDGFDVGVGVAFAVFVGAAVRYQAIEGSLYVAGDVGIGVFVDRDGGSGVRDVEVADAGFDLGFGYEGLHFVADVYELVAAGGCDLYGLHV